MEGSLKRGHAGDIIDSSSGEGEIEHEPTKKKSKLDAEAKDKQDRLVSVPQSEVESTLDYSKPTTSLVSPFTLPHRPPRPALPPVADLPDEIVEKILSHLSLRDLCLSARGVCKSWYRLSHRCDAWKRVDIGRHWRQNRFSLTTPFSSPRSLSHRFLSQLQKLRLLNFSTKYRERRHSASSSYNSRFDPVICASNAFRFPRGPTTDVLLRDLSALLRDNPVVKTLDLTNADVVSSSSCCGARRRSGFQRDDEDDEEEMKINGGSILVSSPRLPPAALVEKVFGNIQQLETLAVETRNFAGFPYVLSIATQPWARTLKTLHLSLSPHEQGVLSRTRSFIDRHIGAEISSRSNYHVLGSLQPLVDSCPHLEALTIELSFGLLPSSAGPHFVRPLRQLAAKGKLKKLRLGVLCLTHALKLFVGRTAKDRALGRFNDVLDALFEPGVGGGGGSAAVASSKELYHPFFGLEAFHLVNLEGQFVDQLPLRLDTLKKLFFSVKSVKELAVSGFRFPLPPSTTGSLQSLQNVENPFVHTPKQMEYLRFLNQLDKFNDQPLLHVGLVTALTELKNFHRLEADLPALCWYGLQPIVKQLKTVEIFGLTWSLATSFLLVIDNVESLAIHTQITNNAAEILQIAAHTLHRLRHLAFYDSNRPDMPFTLRPRVLAQIFAHPNWSRLLTLRIETQDLTPEALLNITAHCSSLTHFHCSATQANNFFGWSLEADADKKALEAFQSLGRLELTLVECRINVHSRFMFDEADWPSDLLARVFELPRLHFKALKNLTFIYRCQQGNFSYSIVESWRGDLIRAIDFWNDEGEISHYLPNEMKTGNGSVGQQKDTHDHGLSGVGDDDGAGVIPTRNHDNEEGGSVEGKSSTNCRLENERSDDTESGDDVRAGSSGVSADSSHMDDNEGDDGNEEDDDDEAAAGVASGLCHVNETAARTRRRSELGGGNAVDDERDVGSPLSPNFFQNTSTSENPGPSRATARSPVSPNVFANSSTPRNREVCNNLLKRSKIDSSVGHRRRGTGSAFASNCGWSWHGTSIATFKEQYRSLNCPRSRVGDAGSFEADLDLDHEWLEQGADVEDEWEDDALEFEYEVESEDDVDEVDQVQEGDEAGDLGVADNEAGEEANFEHGGDGHAPDVDHHDNSNDGH